LIGNLRNPTATFKKRGQPMMQFTGTQEVLLSRAKVWPRLSDVRFLVHCIPGAEKIDQAEENRAVCILRPGLAFIRGTLEVTIERTKMEPEEALAFTLFSKGVGSSSEVASQLTLTEKDGQTQIEWSAEVTKLGGLLKAVPQGLIRGAAQKVIADTWASVVSKLTEGADGSAK
jgi:carbon monoxide dehydrogenase subunit G